MAENIASLKQQRSSAKANISRIKNLIDGTTVSWNIIDLECRLDILNSYIKQIMSYQTEIEKIDPQDDKRSEVEDLCVTTKSKILTLMGPNRRRDYTIIDASLNTTSVNWHRLPKLKLPSFSGKYSEYTAFITSFRNLVHNEDSLPIIEKFNHLLTCLSGDALKTVQAFQVSEENYCKALDRLAERYDKKCLIFFDNIEQLFSLPNIDQPNASMLRNAVDTTSAIYDSLSTIGSDKDIVNALLIHLVMSKVDSVTKSKWNDQLNYSKLPTWDDCSKLLIRRCQSIDIREEQVNKDKDTSTFRKPKNASHTKNRTNATLTCADSSKDAKCHHCNSKDHYIQNCETFIALPIASRFEFVKNNGLCINCMRKGHSVSSCKSSRCRVCQRSHNTLLHKFDVAVPMPTNSTLNGIHSSSLQCLSHNGMIILATALVYIKNKHGVDQMVRAILDSGSQINFISEETVQRLQLKRERGTLHVSGIGEKHTSVKQRVSLSIKSRINNFSFNTDLWIIKSIASQQPESNISIQDWNIPPNLELADPYFYKKQKVDLLLGADTFFDLLSVGQIKLHSTLPTLQKTSLGWIVSGRYTPQKIKQTCNFVEESEQSTLSDIDKTLRRFWELEEVSPPQSSFTAEQNDCEEHFVRTTKLLPNNRFEVHLPFKMEPNTLGTSFDTAIRRFYALERRLSKFPGMQQMYHEFMREYLALGHMELIECIPNSSHFFIPHQCVLRMQSTTTKLRVVFDASARTSTQTSLNDILMVGPTIQHDLYTTLLRFRLYKYAVSADITKMYRQILVNEAHRKFQLIVWRENVNTPLKMYQLNTVTYGTASAPYLAIRCLKELSDKFQNEFPLGSKVLQENFYVDDMLCGADTVEELCKIKTEVVGILDKASFQLAKWCSNCEPNSGSGIELDLDKDQLTRTLGMIWDSQQDVLRFNLITEFEHVKATKRNILSIASRLFDPLGLLCPIMIHAKLIIQDLWLQKVDWDESIPMHLDTSWNHFKEELNSIKLISIPRFVNTVCTEKIEIHGFSDASMRAYGCCIYVRITNTNSPIIHLLTAKSKVAPVKTKSLPRLELCAAHLLAKLWKSVQSIMQKYVSTITFWTDSEITLYWLKTHPSTLSTFVGNRVSEIQEWCNSISWRHVPTKQNPADLASRGSMVHNLLNNKLWFQGPEFLKKHESHWPINAKFEAPLNSESLELRKQHNVCLQILNEENIIFKIVEDKSSYLSILKIVAYIIRFVQNIKNSTNIKSSSIVLSPKELNWAFLKIVSTIQLTEFKDEIKILENGGILQPNLQKLNPFVQQYTEDKQKLKLLRVGGRLLKAPLSFDAKFPLLLTKSSSFVVKYVRHLHISNCHAGAQALVGIMRQLVWVVNARQLARNVVRNCIHCFRYKPKLATQLMGNLPKDRLQSLRPFYICGVDFCGPFQTSHRIRGRQPYKTYASIFVCFSTKAIHIELVSDLSTNAFISILKRFIARRGLPHKIYCDNATNFVGANSKLKELRDFFFNDGTQDLLQNYASQRGVEFVFIPPRSPHFGGLWEASVKSTKNLLCKTIGNVHLTYEELLTILHEIEAILNSRPLSALTDDPNDGEALTPAHWLVGSSLHALPDDTSIIKNQNLSSLKRWQLISALKQQFWSKFQRDYILAQQCRNKWSKSCANLEVGALVIIHEDNRPPQQWKLGRVIATTYGSDGKVRVVDVKTQSGTYRRAIHKLAVLPVT